MAGTGIVVHGQSNQEETKSEVQYLWSAVAVLTLLARNFNETPPGKFNVGVI